MLRFFTFFVLVTFVVGAFIQDYSNLHESRQVELESHHIKPRFSIAEIPNKILEILRERMKDGFPEVGIPPLDPLVIPDLNIDTKDLLGKLGHLKANIQDVVVEGIPTYHVDNVDVKIFQMFMDVNLTLPELTIKGKYNVDGRLHILPIFGQGPFTITVKGIHIRCQGDIKLIGFTNVQLTTLDLTVDPGTMEIFLEGLMGGGDINGEIHQLINNMGNKFLRKTIPLVIKNVALKAKDIVNVIIKDISIFS